MDGLTEAELPLSKVCWGRPDRYRPIGQLESGVPTCDYLKSSAWRVHQSRAPSVPLNWRQPPATALTNRSQNIPSGAPHIERRSHRDRPLGFQCSSNWATARATLHCCLFPTNACKGKVKSSYPWPVCDVPSLAEYRKSSELPLPHQIIRPSYQCWGILASGPCSFVGTSGVATDFRVGEPETPGAKPRVPPNPVFSPDFGHLFFITALTP